jgi:hypothetical protein
LERIATTFASNEVAGLKLMKQPRLAPPMAEDIERAVSAAAHFRQTPQLWWHGLIKILSKSQWDVKKVTKATTSAYKICRKRGSKLHFFFLLLPSLCNLCQILCRCQVISSEFLDITPFPPQWTTKLF